MDLLLILTYTAICVGIFKIFKIPLNKWTVPTAVLGGVFIIGALIVLMNYNHPYSELARNYYVSLHPRRSPGQGSRDRGTGQGQPAGQAG